MTTYDENIKENPFHEALVSNHFDLLEKVSTEGWIVCIPRVGTIKTIADSDLYEHIILPSSWSTLNKTKIHLSNDTIIIQNENGCSNCIKVLFKETYYYQRLKYLIYCVERPLNEVISEPLDGNIENLRDCIDFLWTKTLGREILIKINGKCEEFMSEYKDLSKLNLKQLKEQAQVLYNQCILLTLKHLNEKTRDKIFLDKLKLSTETYMQHCLNDFIFQAICTNTSHADANFNKVIRNLQDLELKHFDVANFSHCVHEARTELNKLNSFLTTLGKINCLKATFNIFSKNNKQTLTAEDLLQLFVFLIIKLNIANWIGNFVYVKNFIFYSAEEQHDESSFLVTTLEAAIEYIKSGVLYRINNDASQSNVLFDNIRLGDLNKIRDVLKDVPDKEINKLCHPLCSCDKCEVLICENKEYTINTYDCKGRNGLHIACMYGYPHIVDFFLHKNLDCNATDYSGNKPIHYSASRGHQNALLLLLHAGADLNAIDCDGNTPLHLACNNGHDNCVKALLYYSEHTNDLIKVSLANNRGNTALHLASKWGYLNITSILIQYNIDITVTNNKNQSALDVAHNYYIKRLLLSTNAFNESSHDKKAPKDYAYGVSEQNSAFGIRPKNLQQFKKVGLLLKAIENNDLPLSCFHLGIPTSPMATNDTPSCHPLCSCEKCHNNDNSDSKFSNTPKEAINFNMCNANGWTPLHMAAKFGRKEILRLLLDTGANVNLQVYKTWHTPLHIACIYQHVAVVKELLECGNCDIDVQDSKGNTAAHYACFKNDVRMLDVLLTKGADVTIKNGNNKTVIQEAEDKLLFNIVKLVRDKGSTSIFRNEKFVLI